jgi:hypothetical protein
MLLDINRHDGSVDRAVGSDSQGCVFKPHQGQNLFFFFFIYNMKSKKCSKKFKSRKIKKILPYP